MKNPLVSVIIPYNKERGYLKACVESIENQTYPKIEIIHSVSNNGVSYNINRGIEKSKGQYIKYISEDDLLIKTCIEDSLKAIEGFDFIHGKAVNFWRDGKMTTHIPNRTQPTLKEMIQINRIHGTTLMYRRDVFERFGKFDENLTTGEEYDFNMMLLSKGAKIGYCDAVLAMYRRHSKQKSLGLTVDQRKRAIIINGIKERYINS